MESRLVVPAPPEPFDPETIEVPAGLVLFRVHAAERLATTFNPGFGAPTRFAFFGEPMVPVLYAAETEQAAIAETLLHDTPLSGGTLLPSAYRGRRLSRITTARPLRFASLLGLGLRRLGVSADQVTATPAAHYQHTVHWARAAHEAGFDGIAYMSRQCNSDRAFVFFGDRAPAALAPESELHWDFDDPTAGLPRLITFCTALGVEVVAR
ncbi:RES family NAD+ phosphorylase [Mycetocola saprophilus]|uniref:RES family NAD+ phosphorylase n=1 Tax=Mycetocola saprophilus TaxID=76636 RepID=UPI003BF223E4